MGARPIGPETGRAPLMPTAPLGQALTVGIPTVHTYIERAVGIENVHNAALTRYRHDFAIGDEARKGYDTRWHFSCVRFQRFGAGVC